MLIGELSKRTDFSHDIIRCYEKKGLVEANKKERRGNNCKEYPLSVYEKLVLIKTVKEHGITIGEMNDFIQGCLEDNTSCSTLTHHLSDKVNRADQQMGLLQLIRNKLTLSLKKCQCPDCQFEKMIPRCMEKFTQ